MRGGFTLLEVVVALLLLEIAVVAATATLAVASRTLTRAQHLERAVLEAEGVLDSLAGVDMPVSGWRPVPGGEVAWTVEATGTLQLRVSRADGSSWLELTSAVPTP